MYIPGLCGNTIHKNVRAKDKRSGLKVSTGEKDRSRATAVSEKGAPEREDAARILTNGCFVEALLGVWCPPLGYKVKQAKS